MKSLATVLAYAALAASLMLGFVVITANAVERPAADPQSVALLSSYFSN